MASDADDAYHLLQEWTPGRSFLCSDASVNIVTLKRLEDDCLHRQQLHPSIRDRLVRVRELPHPRIATLRSVERWQGIPCLVWTFLEGESWNDTAIGSDQLLPMLSALAVSVDTLHQNGIVHGSLHAKNVIVRPGPQVWLTHVSPYLYADPQVDILATAELIRQIIPSEFATRIIPLVEQLESSQCTLHEFSNWVLDREEKTSVPTAPEKPKEYRVSSLLMALVVTCFSLTLWIIIQKLELKPTGHRATTFPSLKH